ncbi:MAG: hypothetical protein GXY75_07415 [Bacteroidales bacterium]|jgi:hypothetical protein|nr:hypothetical protein [Bacteroidales bacterium]
MKVLIAAIIIVGFSFLAMSVTIIFKKGGKFPDGEISRNKHLREKGIVCAKDEELRIWGRKNKCDDDAECSESGCETCAFNTFHNPKQTPAK